MPGVFFTATRGIDRGSVAIRSTSELSVLLVQLRKQKISDGGFIAVGQRQRNPEECKHGSGRGGDKDIQAPGDELHH